MVKPWWSWSNHGDHGQTMVIMVNICENMVDHGQNDWYMVDHGCTQLRPWSRWWTMVKLMTDYGNHGQSFWWTWLTMVKMMNHGQTDNWPGYHGQSFWCTWLTVVKMMDHGQTDWGSSAGVHPISQKWQRYQSSLFTIKYNILYSSPLLDRSLQHTWSQRRPDTIVIDRLPCAKWAMMREGSHTF